LDGARRAGAARGGGRGADAGEIAHQMVGGAFLLTTSQMRAIFYIGNHLGAGGALAELDQFEQALETIARAVELAERGNQAELVRTLKARQNLYNERERYHDPTPRAAAGAIVAASLQGRAINRPSPARNTRQ